MKTDLSSTDKNNTPTDSGYDSKEDIKPTDETPNSDSDNSETHDDYGYESETPSDEVKKVEDDKKPEDKKPDETPADDKEVKDPSTGYGDEENADDKPDEKKPDEDKKDDDKKPEDEVTDAEKVKSEITESLKGLPEGYDQEKILEFAVKNGLNNDQAKAYVEMEKTANAEYRVNQEAAVKANRAASVKELKDDPTFGGENFARNVNNVEKLLEKQFPNFKKVLTDRGGIVPPYIMKDLLALHKVLNPTTTLVNGDAIPPKTEGKENFLDDMYN